MDSDTDVLNIDLTPDFVQKVASELREKILSFHPP